MIETIIYSGEEAREIYNKKGIEFNTQDKALSLLEGGKEMGSALFFMDKEKIVIKDISPKDNFALMDGALRSALFVAANRSIMKAYWDKTLDGGIIERLGFCGNRQKCEIDITNLFSSCENCKK